MRDSCKVKRVRAQWKYKIHVVLVNYLCNCHVIEYRFNILRINTAVINWRDNVSRLFIASRTHITDYT